MKANIYFFLFAKLFLYSTAINTKEVLGKKGLTQCSIIKLKWISQVD